MPWRRVVGLVLCLTYVGASAAVWCGYAPVELSYTMMTVFLLYGLCVLKWSI